MPLDPGDLVLAALSAAIVVVVVRALVRRSYSRPPRLRLLTGSHAQRAALRLALAPVLDEFLPLLDRAGQQVRAIVLVPTLSGSEGEALATQIEQLSGSTVFIVRLAHRLGTTLRQPEEVAGALAEDLLYLYRHAAPVTVVRQTPATSGSNAAAQTMPGRKSVGPNGPGVLPRQAASEAEETVVPFKASPLGPRNGQSS